MGWIQFYDMLYTLDEVERPPDKIMADDEKLDEWYEHYRRGVVQRLKKHHKDMKTGHVDHDPPPPRKGFVFGGEKK